MPDRFVSQNPLIANASGGIGRRGLLNAGLAVGASQVTSPFVTRVRAADIVKVGLDNPLTGPLAALGKNDLIGCQLALEQINVKGGILGRSVDLVVEDSTQR